MAKFKYNKGEWSEFYAFLKLLETKKLNLANEKNKNIFFPILKIFKKNEFLEYVLNSEKIEVFMNDKFIKTVETSLISDFADKLFVEIKKQKSAFEVKNAENFLKYIECSNIKESKTKFDILLELHDIFSGFNQICGFSIKSDVGSPPTLLNASGATKFIYEVTGLSKDKIKKLANLENISKSWIIDSVNEIFNLGGKFKFNHISNENFNNNLMLIDSLMPEIMANLLLKAFSNKNKNCDFLLDLLEKENALNYAKNGFYVYKFKKLLSASALGMKPSILWNGIDEANGGYIVVKKNGEIIGYHLYNRNYFENYLFENTTISTPSTTRYNYAKIYEKNNKFYFDLILQIRFI